MRATDFVILSGFLGGPLTFAQFGGRKGDAVILVVSAKGNSDLQVVPPSTTNCQTGFTVEDPTTLFDEPFGPDFPGWHDPPHRKQPGAALLTKVVCGERRYEIKDGFNPRDVPRLIFHRIVFIQPAAR